jgi:hypothetical protein
VVRARAGSCKPSAVGGSQLWRSHTGCTNWA